MDKINIYDIAIITIWGTILLITSLINKMPVRQRAALFALSAVIGGALLIIAAKAEYWGLALVIGLLLGILIAELRHLK